MLRLRHGISSRDRGGGAIRAAILAAIAGSLGLALFGLLRYPGLRTGVTVWVSLALFLPLLGAYVLAGLTLCRGVDARAARARLQAVIGGVLVGAAWLVVLVPHSSRSSSCSSRCSSRCSPPAASRWGRWALRDVAMASAAALWSGIIGALLAFIVWVTTTYARREADEPSSCATSTRAARVISRPTPSATPSASRWTAGHHPCRRVRAGLARCRLAAGQGGDERAREPVGS